MKKLQIFILMFLSAGIFHSMAETLSVKIVKPESINNQVVLLTGQPTEFNALVSGNQGGPYICYNWDFGGTSHAIPDSVHSTLGNLHTNNQSVMATFLPAAKGKVIPITLQVKDQCRFIANTSLHVVIPSVEIEKCPAAFVPKGGTDDNTVQIKAKVTPSTLKGKFKFTLFDVSDEKGFCLNAPQKVPGGKVEDSDFWKDLQFPKQTGFTVSGSNDQIAQTTSSALSESTVVVKSFDYGSYGKIKVEFIVDGTNLKCLGLEQGGAKQFTHIPLDEDNNHIADSAPQNSGPEASKAATDDNDGIPAGGGTRGDGLTRYEEYRGFIVNGVHTRLDVHKKDVFVRNVDLIGEAGLSGFFTTAALTAPVSAILNSEWISTSRIVNFNHETSHENDQQAIKVTNAGSSSDGLLQGLTLATAEPFVPNRQVYCKVYATTIRKGTKLIENISATNTIVKVVATAGYRPAGGIFKIQQEEIAYAGITATSFTNCTRGVNGTTAVAHKKNRKVFFYVNENDFIKRTLAHEVGHLVGLEENPLANENIMSEPGVRGTSLGDGFWSDFIGKSSALTGEFTVKE